MSGTWFKLHVIPPPRPLGWESPSRLLQDTLWHHLIRDSAPIGHFYIELKSETPWKNGASHILTGMSRRSPNLSTLKVISERVGLGAFFHDFPGKLDEGIPALRKLKDARSRGRLKSLRVDLTPERAHLLFDELNEWILHGSHRHYGGGHRILKGEGAGCAEMGAHFLNLALGRKATPSEWIRSVVAPRELVGGPLTGKKVGIVRVLFAGKSWAKDEQEGIRYSTPDMELAWDWLERFAPGQSEVILDPTRVTWSTEEARRITFAKQGEKLEPWAVEREWSLLRLDRDTF